MVGHAHGPEGLGPPDLAGDVPIAAGLAVGDGLQGLPNLTLEGGGRRGQGQIEGLPLPRQIFQQLPPPLLQQRSGAGNEPGHGSAGEVQSGDGALLLPQAHLPQGGGK